MKDSWIRSMLGIMTLGMAMLPYDQASGNELAFKFRAEVRVGSTVRYLDASKREEAICPGEKYALYVLPKKAGWFYAVKFHRVDGKPEIVYMHSGAKPNASDETFHLGASEWTELDDAEGEEAIYVVESSRSLKDGELTRAAVRAKMIFSPKPGGHVPTPLTIIDRGDGENDETQKWVLVEPETNGTDWIAVHRFVFQRDHKKCRPVT